ncbi:hypothetical protein THRCLA_10996, partial [Thraustotheca clavata]
MLLEGDTMLHLAVRANRDNIIDLLLRSQGIDSTIQNKVSSTEILIDHKHSLGAGAFGCVYKGTFNGESVAVKTAHEGKENMLLQEISLMIQCRSPYIVDVVAKSTMKPPKLALQYMDCGDLRKYLNAKQYNVTTTIEVAPLQVAW